MLALPAALVAALLAVQTPLHTFHGDSAGDEFGVAAAFAGDANRDGYADILVGAHWDDNNGTNSGSARLFSGLDGSVLATYLGDAAGDFFGLSVVGLGDVNGDGFDDFAVGADGSDINGAESGLVRVFSGKTGAILRNIPGTGAGAQFGTTLAAIGDPAISILVGAPGSNQVIVVESTTGVTTRWFPGAAPGDQFGSAVTSGRDLTGDGIPDYAIGAPGDDVGATDSGSVAIYSGSTGLLVRTLRGIGAGDRFGTAVAMVPDANGDGRADLVIGAPRADGPGSDAGAVYVYSGTSGLLIFSRTGEAAGDQFGGSLASIATRTGNPEPAFVVGARQNDFGGNNAGSAYVYSALTGAQLQVLRGRAPGDWFGGAVAGGDDANGDGLGDMLVSARLADVNGPDSGSVEVYPSPIVPSTWFVDAAAAGLGTGTQANPYRWIQYAIDHPATRAGDTILIAPGTYYENVVIDSKVLRLAKSGVDRPVLDGQQLTSVVTVLGNPRMGTRLDGLKVRNGELYDPDPINGEDAYGAGIYSPRNSLEIFNCIVTENVTQYQNRANGIGIYAEGPKIRIVGCEITGNWRIGSYFMGVSYGGGMNVGGDSVEVIDCLISRNSNECNGGGMSVGGASVLIRGCEISFNGTEQGEDGGGLYVYSLGTANVELCDVRNNIARDSGAGIATSGSVVIRDSVFDGNVCGEGSYYGGGVWAKTPGTEIFDCVISGNVTNRGGGTAGPLIARNSTFIGNAATSLDSTFGGYCGRGGAMSGGTAINCLFDANDFGGAIHHSNCPASVAADATLINCTVVNNYAPPLPDYGTTFENCTLDSCIVWSNQGDFGDPLTSAVYSNIEGGQPGVGNIAVDPLFLAPVGGNYHLTSLSPCIDAGSPALPLDPDGSRADMGAYPYDPNYCPPPFTYCTAKTNSCGGVPAISSVGTPSASATSGFTVTATGARPFKNGLLMYSPNGQWNAAFQGGTLCIAPQALRRGPPVISSGGTGGALCDATFSIDWAAFANGVLGGNPQAYLTSIGQRVNVQWWGRDSQAGGSYLSNAIQYEVCP